MAEYRKNEILKHGGKPLDESKMTNAEIFEESFKAYEQTGDVHPEIEKVITKSERTKQKDDEN